MRLTFLSKKLLAYTIGESATEAWEELALMKSVLYVLRARRKLGPSRETMVFMGTQQGQSDPILGCTVMAMGGRIQWETFPIKVG
jgi:hypothetical protein